LRRNDPIETIRNRGRVLKELKCNHPKNSFKLIRIASDKKISVDRWSDQRKWADITDEFISEIAKKELNVGLLTGEVSGVTVIDIDGEIGLEQFRRVVEEKACIDEIVQYPTLTQFTPSGGFHLIYAYESRIPRGTVGVFNHISTNNNDENLQHQSVDIRNGGGYILLAPSIISSSKYKKYVFKNIEAPIRKMPEGLVRAILESPNYSVKNKRSFSRHEKKRKSLLVDEMLRQQEEPLIELKSLVDEFTNITMDLVADKYSDKEIRNYLLGEYYFRVYKFISSPNLELAENNILKIIKRVSKSRGSNKKDLSLQKYEDTPLGLAGLNDLFFKIGFSRLKKNYNNKAIRNYLMGEYYFRVYKYHDKSNLEITENEIYKLVQSLSAYRK